MKPYLLIPEKDILGSIKADMLNNVVNRRTTTEQALSIATQQLASYWCYNDMRAARKHYKEAEEFLTKYLEAVGVSISEPA